MNIAKCSGSNTDMGLARNNQQPERVMVSGTGVG